MCRLPPASVPPNSNDSLRTPFADGVSTCNTRRRRRSSPRDEILEYNIWCCWYWLSRCIASLFHNLWSSHWYWSTKLKVVAVCLGGVSLFQVTANCVADVGKTSIMDMAVEVSEHRDVDLPVREGGKSSLGLHKLNGRVGACRFRWPSCSHRRNPRTPVHNPS